jgi:hypothetical protein
VVGTVRDRCAAPIGLAGATTLRWGIIGPGRTGLHLTEDKEAMR